MEHTTVCSATGPYIDGGGSEDADCSLCCRQRPAQLRKHADEKRLRLMVVCYPRSFSSLLGHSKRRRLQQQRRRRRREEPATGSNCCGNALTQPHARVTFCHGRFVAASLSSLGDAGRQRSPGSCGMQTGERAAENYHNVSPAPPPPPRRVAAGGR